MLQSLKLVGVGPAPEMEMHFAPRLNVLTGDNGLGKSLFLETIWYVLTGNWAGMPAWPRPDAEEAAILSEGEAAQKGQSVFKDKSAKWSIYSFYPTRSLVIYARVDGSVRIFDPKRSYQGLGDGMLFSLSPEQILNGIKDHNDVLCRGLIEDWVTWQEKKEGTPGSLAFVYLCRILEILSPSLDPEEMIRPATPIRMLGDSRTFPTIDTGYDAIPIIHASAAMQRIVGLAYLITWAWHEHAEESRLLKEKPVKNLVFLMDEVENHLHPEWQRRILPALLKVLESLGDGMQVQMHVTTHSPMVLASLEPHWKNELDQLFLFALEEGKVVLKSDDLVRTGDASRWLTSPIFHLESARSVEAERAMDDARAVMRGEEPRFFRTPEEIDSELKRTLPGQDTFWPRWLIFMGDADK